MQDNKFSKGGLVPFQSAEDVQNLMDFNAKNSPGVREGLPGEWYISKEARAKSGVSLLLSGESYVSKEAFAQYGTELLNALNGTSSDAPVWVRLMGDTYINVVKLARFKAMAEAQRQSPDGPMWVDMGELFDALLQLVKESK